MQLVLLANKSDPPTRTAACEATAAAVITLLTDPRAQDAWREEIERWTAGRIRKHFRRARGAAWDRVQQLDGITLTRNGATVRAFVPSSTDNIPRDIAKLQLSGSELPDPDARPHIAAVGGGPLVVSVQPDPFLPLGKAAAACGHAAQISWLDMPAERRQGWAAAGFPVQVEQPDTDSWAAALAAAQVRVVDAGFTIVESGTTTALARWA